MGNSLALGKHFIPIQLRFLKLFHPGMHSKAIFVPDLNASVGFRDLDTFSDVLAIYQEPVQFISSPPTTSLFDALVLTDLPLNRISCTQAPGAVQSSAGTPEPGLKTKTLYWPIGSSRPRSPIFVKSVRTGCWPAAWTGDWNSSTSDSPESPPPSLPSLVT